MMLQRWLLLMKVLLPETWLQRHQLQVVMLQEVWLQSAHRRQDVRVLVLRVAGHRHLWRGSAVREANLVRQASGRSWRAAPECFVFVVAWDASGCTRLANYCASCQFGTGPNMPHLRVSYSARTMRFQPL
jgi:hypothetical protein